VKHTSPAVDLSAMLKKKILNSQEKIDFMWYLKKIAWVALIGFAAGIAVFLIQTQLGF
jgi:hypothetical protein